MADVTTGLSEIFEVLVRGGLSPENAEKSLLSMADPAQVRAARVEFEKKVGKIRSLRIPPALVGGGVAGWYAGPQRGDRYWPAFRQYLSNRGWGELAISSLDDASTRVVSMLEHPGVGQFSTRGLVLGYVQSGKTANFTATIAKAADAGYRLFIVLSGLHNSLRRQTQIRLEKELVRLNPENWVCLTSADEDFKAGRAGNVNAFLTDNNGLVVLCVVKKNAAVLKRLRRWLRNARDQVVRSCPVLIIDDEADQASVNTGGDGSRNAINQLILDILSRLPRVAYVGYTATPFANVLIDPLVPEDLYPRDFIVDLPRPEGYFGSERLFGRDLLPTDDPDAVFSGLDMIREVPAEEVSSLKPAGRSDRSSFSPGITGTLRQALHYFWMASAARFARSDQRHSTMLVHTTLYSEVHDRFRAPINAERVGLAQSVRTGDEVVVDGLRSLWNEENQKVNSAELGESGTSFDELLPYLAEILERTQITVENSLSTERLVYDEYDEERDDVEGPAVGKTLIVIGGNILSRGLTLEGLSVSFFVRTSTAYDTLLQMGRWFGYRPRYADLPRIWMTAELIKYFYDLATVEREIRDDVRRYEIEGITPLEAAVRIRTHPQLSVTSRLKMQAATECDISYSNRRVQTILFKHRDLAWLRNNLEAARSFISGLIERGSQPQERGGNQLFTGVSVDEFLDFLAEYRIHEESSELNRDLLSSYVQAQRREGALSTWNVAIVGLSEEGVTETIPLVRDLPVPLLNRSRLVAGKSATDYASLGVIMSNIDQVADINVTRREVRGMSAAAIRSLRLDRYRAEGREAPGLLLLYPISRNSEPAAKESGRRAPLEAVEHLIGLGIVFPPAVRETPQKYVTVDLSSLEREQPDLPAEEEDEESTEVTDSEGQSK